MATENVVQWLCSNLSKCLGIDASPEIAEYILSLECRSDLEEYLSDLLDTGIPSNRRFITELLERWSKTPRKVAQNVPDDGMIVYQKKVPVQSSTHATSHEKKKIKEVVLTKPTQNGAIPKRQQNSRVGHGKDTKKENSPAKKFVPLFGEDGKAKTSAKIPGRFTCECQTMKHPLVNNCLSCGRVVCEQEGSGPCFYCQTLVVTKAEEEILNRDDHKSKNLLAQLYGTSLEDPTNVKLPSQNNSRVQLGQNAAQKHCEKLLEFDRSSAKRTQVLDDESDYFNTDSHWLSKTDREALKNRDKQIREQRYASRLEARKMNLDFAGRQVVENDDIVDAYNMNDNVVQQIHYGQQRKNSVEDHVNYDLDDVQQFGDLVNPTTKDIAPQYIPTESVSRNAVKLPESITACVSKRKELRIQDQSLLEMSDNGSCMSMHQPWASLLTAGIKRHEGRTWYSAHRGRLWIAATAQTPSEEDIEMVQQQYLDQYNVTSLAFPDHYPTGCLLGCVEVTDCLAQEDYQHKFSGEEESGSPYVFTCQHPHELLVKFPMKGQHKIYKLDPQLHKQAKRGILPASPALHTPT